MSVRKLTIKVELSPILELICLPSQIRHATFLLMYVAYVQSRIGQLNGDEDTAGLPIPGCFRHILNWHGGRLILDRLLTRR